MNSRNYRKKSGRFILEGYHLLNEALEAEVEIETILYTDEFVGRAINRRLLAKAGETRIIKVPSKVFKAIAQTENPQGVGAIARFSRCGVNSVKEDDRFFLMLDGIQDPGNLGTIVRTAAAAPIDGIFLLPGTVDPYNPKALRATMGGVFNLPVHQVSGIEQCCRLFAQKDFQFVAADPRGETFYHDVDFSRPSVVIIGNESRGVQNKLLEKADTRAVIPLEGKIAALNAAVAASLFIFEYRRQQRRKQFTF